MPFQKSLPPDICSKIFFVTPPSAPNPTSCSGYALWGPRNEAVLPSALGPSDRSFVTVLLPRLPILQPGVNPIPPDFIGAPKPARGYQWGCGINTHPGSGSQSWRKSALGLRVRCPEFRSHSGAQTAVLPLARFLTSPSLRGRPLYNLPSFLYTSQDCGDCDYLVKHFALEGS